jgi:flagellar basal-body rod protein FlgB
MDPVSAVLISKVLDGLSMRSLATAQNIANANSADYRPLRVSFEEALRGAAAKGPNAVSHLKPAIEHVPVAEVEDELRLDLELETASETALRYAALIDLLGRQLQLTRTVINEGK